MDLTPIDAAVFKSCRDDRCQWLSQVDRVDRVQRHLVIHEPVIDTGIVAAVTTTGNRFEPGGRLTAPLELGQQQSGDMGLAHARVRAGDEIALAHSKDTGSTSTLIITSLGRLVAATTLPSVSVTGMIRSARAMNW